MQVHTVEKLKGSLVSSCMHDHKTYMNLIILGTFYPPICENSLQMGSNVGKKVEKRGKTRGKTNKQTKHHA